MPKRIKKNSNSNTVRLRMLYLKSVMVWIGFCLIFNFFFPVHFHTDLPCPQSFITAELSQLISCVPELPGLGGFFQVKLIPGPELKGVWRQGHTPGWSISFHLCRNHLLASCSFVMRRGRETKSVKGVIFKQTVKTWVVLRIFFFRFAHLQPSLGDGESCL